MREPIEPPIRLFLAGVAITGRRPVKLHHAIKADPLEQHRHWQSSIKQRGREGGSQPGTSRASSIAHRERERGTWVPVGQPVPQARRADCGGGDGA